MVIDRISEQPTHDEGLLRRKGIYYAGGVVKIEEEDPH